jgi:hypothetical protein
MNTKNAFAACLIGALINAIFIYAPILNLTNFLLCAPLWASAIFSVWLYKRINGSLAFWHGVIIGLVIGLMTWIIELLSILILLSGGTRLMEASVSVISAVPALYHPTNILLMLFTLFGAEAEIVFGVFGGLAGGLLFRTKR